MIDDSARTTTHGRPWYAEGRWTHLAPILGILAVLLWLIGIFIVESGENSPNSDATQDQIVLYFEENSTRILLGGFLFALGTAVFIAFLAHVRTRLDADGALDRGSGVHAWPSPLSTIVFTLGTAVALFATAAVAPQLGGAITATETDEVAMNPGAAEAFWNLGDGFYIIGQALLFVFFLAAGLAILRSRFLPAWLGWVTMALGIVAVIAPIGWIALVFGIPLWTLAVAALMWMRKRDRDDMAPPATTRTRTVT